MEYILQSVPYNKDDIIHAFESGILSFIVESQYCEEVRRIGHVHVYNYEEIHYITIHAKEDEIEAITRLRQGHHVVITHGADIIPLENIIAQYPSVWLEVYSDEDSILASRILEHGVGGVVFTHSVLKNIQSHQATSYPTYQLSQAKIIDIIPIPLGDRVCVDTLTLCTQGQGMLIGNTSAFLFLVHAETAHNEYVASRPFRINAGSVHNYAMMPHDRTCYLSELHAGANILICNHRGECISAIVGRVKIERRPMLMITAECDGIKGTIFLQNAETITLVDIEGNPRSVARLSIGDNVLIHRDSAGRHFGMRIQENIIES